MGMAHKLFTFTSHEILEGSCVIPHFGGLNFAAAPCGLPRSHFKKQGIDQHTPTNKKRKGPPPEVFFCNKSCFKTLVHIWEI